MIFIIFNFQYIIGWGSFTVRLEIEFDGNHCDFHHDLDIFSNTKEKIRAPILEGIIVAPEKKKIEKKDDEGEQKMNEEGFLVINVPKWVVLPHGFEEDCKNLG